MGCRTSSSAGGRSRAYPRRGARTAGSARVAAPVAQAPAVADRPAAAGGRRRSGGRSGRRRSGRRLDVRRGLRLGRFGARRLAGLARLVRCREGRPLPAVVRSAPLARRAGLVRPARPDARRRLRRPARRRLSRRFGGVAASAGAGRGRGGARAAPARRRHDRSGGGGGDRRAQPNGANQANGPLAPARSSAAAAAIRARAGPGAGRRAARGARVPRPAGDLHPVGLLAAARLTAGHGRQRDRDPSAFAARSGTPAGAAFVQDYVRHESGGDHGSREAESGQ